MLNNQDLLNINTIRFLSLDAIEQAQSGHPGLVLGASTAAYTLWNKHLKINPSNPNWFNRDRFVLSAGHASMLLYSLMHLWGYEDVSLDEIKSFRQWGSKTPGHPEYGHTKGIETSTGPLGQGLANAVGMAMAENHLAALYNTDNHKIVDYYTYVLAGDGCMMEGISSESASLAGTLKLNKLIVLYDDNQISIEGDTSVTFDENVDQRFLAYGWNILNVDDANDVVMIDEAISQAKESNKPTLIHIKSKIGYGTPLEGNEVTHGAPIGKNNIEITKKNLNWEYEESFKVPDSVKKYFSEKRQSLQEINDKWDKLYKDWGKHNPIKKAEFESDYKKKATELLYCDDFWSIKGDMPTRKASGEILNFLSKKYPILFGGSADLAPSTNTILNDFKWYSTAQPEGKNIHFGVREHAMGAIVNGITLSGHLKGFGSSFFAFTDYMKGSMRMSAIMNIPSLFIMTHDSIGVGEDGPTHQPIEHLGMLRMVPNMIVFRPADATETAAGYYISMTKDSPVTLVLSRQTLPYVGETTREAIKGAYILKDSEDPEMILIASGSEVSIALEVHSLLKAEGIQSRVVSMPSMELFDSQDKSYRDSILPSSISKRISIEAGSTMPWYKYIGSDGIAIGIDRYGASSPAKEIFENYGLTAEKIVRRIKETY